MQMQSQSSGRYTPRVERSTALPEALSTHLAAAAARHGFRPEAVEALWRAMALGQGSMAQFSHPELGGRGQWMRGGMLMVGDMFNNDLRARVGALCEALERLHAQHPEWHETVEARAAGGRGEWWPDGLNAPSTSGAQNGIRYAFFPGQRRLAIERAGKVELYDTGDHMIGSAAQQQGDRQTLQFASQNGPIELAALRRVDEDGDEKRHLFAASAERPETLPSDTAAAPRTAPRGDHEVLLQTIAGLAALHARGVLTDQEFSDKKAELLGRL